MSAPKLESHADPQKPPYFYLSYAHAEDKQKVQKFFKDLSDSIRRREGLPLTEIVGCCDAVEENAGDREAGLRTSRVMIALLSLSYFRDKAAGREWRIFEKRKEKSDSPSKRVILPIVWSSYSGPIPVVINQTPSFNENGAGSEPIVNMLRTREKQRDYVEFVTNLANYIVDSTASFQLPEIESIPDEVSDAFENVEEPPINSQTINTMPKEILNQNILIFDGAFAKSLAEQVKNTSAPPAPVSNVGSAVQTTQSTKTASEKYLVFTIDDKPGDMQKVETTARISADFDVKSYTDFTELVDEVSELVKERKEPDLIVVNPTLTHPETHNYTLIQTLLEKKVPSAILAISKDADTRRLLTSIGISDLVATLPKSFTTKELIQLMRHWAKTGRDKRYRRGRSDERPVFLSFASQDEAMASKICKWLELREIGVWYSYETLKPGDPWIEKIKQGLASAEVFIALISNEYPKSDFCQAELGVILDRLANQPDHLRVIPVHYHEPTEALKDRQIEKYLTQQAVAISDSNWLPGLQQILETVQDSLKPRQNEP